MNFMNIKNINRIYILTPFLLISLILNGYFQTISIENFKNHLNYLGSDELMGRGTGTLGELKAAEYIAQQLKNYNLEAIGDKNSFYQTIPMHGSFPLASTDLKIYTNSEVMSLKLHEDYFLYKSGASTFIPSPLPLVFVGYGILAPEYDYNDYASIDVEGKIVVFLSGEPYSADQDYFNGEHETIYSNPDTKQRIAISRGARGSIMILNPNRSKNWDYWKKEFAFEDITLAYSVSGNLSVLLKQKVAEKIFKNEKFSFGKIFKMEKENKMTSFQLNAKLSIKSFFKERDFISKNVVALLNGHDSKYNDTYLLLSAHYDHLGIGPPVNGDSIYNGVFDNAAGVAALLELARNLALRQNTLRRSIIFLFTTGEEKGLLGSTYYTDHPIKPLYKTIANINIDGISLFEKVNNFIGIGAEYSSIKTHLQNVLNQMALNLSPLPERYFSETESISASDHFSFAKSGIPFLIVLEGLNYKNSSWQEGLNRIISWNENIYHTPFDDLKQPTNYQAAEQHCQVLLELCMYIANNEESPRWNKGEPFLTKRLQTIAEKR